MTAQCILRRESLREVVQLLHPVFSNPDLPVQLVPQGHGLLLLAHHDNCSAQIPLEGQLNADEPLVAAFSALIRASQEQDAVVILHGTPRQAPQAPFFLPRSSVRAQTADLHRALHKVRPAMSQDSARPDLNGVSFAAQAHALHLAATDGNRLHWAEVQTVGPPDVPTNTILHRSVVSLLHGCLGRSSADWSTIAFSSDGVQITAGALRIQAPLRSAAFPNYQGLTHPKTAPTRRMRLDVSPMCRILRGIQPITRHTGCVRLDFAPTALHITAMHEGVVDGGSVPAVLDGLPISTGFDPRYLLEALEATQGPWLWAAVWDTLGACHFQEPGRSDHLFVIMPMRLH